jgi:hypothetical protein
MYVWNNATIIIWPYDVVQLYAVAIRQYAVRVVDS